MERDRVVDLDDRPFGEHRILRECAELTVSHQVFVAEMTTTGSIGGHFPGEQTRTGVADVALAVHTKPATAARRNERHRHVVPRLHRRHARPDFFDDTGALVTTEHRKPVRLRDTGRGPHLGGRQHVAGDEVIVGVADAGDGHPHQDFSGVRRIEIDLADLPVHADPAKLQRHDTSLHPP